MSKPGYLERILRARVYDVAIETPLERAPRLSARLGNEVLIKREDLQPVFSFKLRGAYNKIASLTPAELQRGVITYSSGNHAQGVAYAARALGAKAVIVMPDRDTPGDSASTCAQPITSESIRETFASGRLRLPKRSARSSSPPNSTNRMPMSR